MYTDLCIWVGRPMPPGLHRPPASGPPERSETSELRALGWGKADAVPVEKNFAVPQWAHVDWARTMGMQTLDSRRGENNVAFLSALVDDERSPARWSSLNGDN
ncbi:hypothetical protein B0H17DRAFT_1134104 [Mycena rosella]|uniref:Uncharacterized protein n=1 Tax=Mycena rosella TaxID=1033263 RepID=A0AAD7DG24_MYCRO|nr:hypothetical protein B0H17DRAFT_1134104 [Mycena rosella]